jgi:hypothetical protein
VMRHQLFDRASIHGDPGVDDWTLVVQEN